MQKHPGVPVVDNLEDIWRVSKLQRERKAEAEAKKKAHLARMRVRDCICAGADSAVFAVPHILRISCT
jgi:hypothetical protein